MFQNIKDTFNQFPQTYWVVAGTHFIDVIGNILLTPFFALYVTQKIGIGMTQAGILLATNSIAGMVGSTIGAAMADCFGRRGIILFGLVVSALSGLTLGFVNKFYFFYGLSVFVSHFAHPSWHAGEVLTRGGKTGSCRPLNQKLRVRLGGLSCIMKPSQTSEKLNIDPQLIVRLFRK